MFDVLACHFALRKHHLCHILLVLIDLMEQTLTIFIGLGHEF
jgi:hypothetical protein